MGRLRSLATVAGVLVTEAGALGAVWAMGSARWATITWDHPSVWLLTSQPTDIAAATVRVLAMAGLAWLLAATIMQVVVTVCTPDSRATRVPGLPDALRRRIEAALATLVAAGTLAAPGIAAAAPGLPDHIPVPVPREVVASHDDVAAPPPLIAPPAPSPTAPPPDDAAAAPAELAPATAGAVHTVVTGDHLWSIAQRQVHAADPDATTTEVAAYWRDVIEVNRDDLASGDPDLIYPGEQVDLPPLHDRKEHP